MLGACMTGPANPIRPTSVFQEFQIGLIMLPETEQANKTTAATCQFNLRKKKIDLIYKKISIGNILTHEEFHFVSRTAG